jgi:hypothetical protein
MATNIQEAAVQKIALQLCTLCLGLLLRLRLPDALPATPGHDAQLQLADWRC